MAILEKNLRVDGRKLDQIRPLHAEVGIIPRTHGTGLFNRGETQVLSVVTLGSPGDDLSIETMERDGEAKYFHHYNLLPFSVGEVKPIRGAGRRDIGHGVEGLTNDLIARGADTVFSDHHYVHSAGR